MAEKRKLVLTKLATEHITTIHQFLLNQGSKADAEELMDDFLDIVFGEIPRFPEQFPVCEGVRSGSSDYRMGSLVGDYRVIFQILRDKVLILMILHEEELPF